MLLEKVDNYETKKKEQLRDKAGLLSIRAREAASVVQQFGNAVVEGKQIISTGDITGMVAKLRYYADWLERISNGEEVAESDLIRMEEIISSVRIPKQNKYKRDIIEVIYVATHPVTGKATRHKLLEMPTQEIFVNDKVVIPEIIVGKGTNYGRRLNKRN